MQTSLIFWLTGSSKRDRPYSRPGDRSRDRGAEAGRSALRVLLAAASSFSPTFPYRAHHGKQHGGATHLDNLALACWQCNLKKGPNLTGIDPETGEITRLFHPRQDTWGEHFQFQENRVVPERMEIVGLTPAGRATARLLDMNEELRQALRYELLR